MTVLNSLETLKEVNILGGQKLKSEAHISLFLQCIVWWNKIDSHIYRAFSTSGHNLMELMHMYYSMVLIKQQHGH